MIGAAPVAGREPSVPAVPIASVCTPAVLVIIPLVAAAWLPPEFSPVRRQILLGVWGIAAIFVAERLLFSGSVRESLRSLGARPSRGAMLPIVLLAIVPMWLFLPLLAWWQNAAVALKPQWLLVFAGVVLVNGVAEEAIHRGFVFGHLRAGRSFAAAAAISAALFGAQHLYLIVTNDWMIGVASVVLALLLAYPLAFVFERSGYSLLGPSLLHTSSNAPALIFDLPQTFLATALIPHMGVVLASLYLIPLAYRFRASDLCEPRHADR